MYTTRLIVEQLRVEVCVAFITAVNNVHWIVLIMLCTVDKINLLICKEILLHDYKWEVPRRILLKLTSFC